MKEITFVAHSRVFGYRPGQVIKIKEHELSQPMRALLAVGKHLTLIDPLEIEDDSKKSAGDTKERSTANGTNNGHSNQASSGKRENGTTSDSVSGDGGDGGSSPEHSSSKGDAEG